MTSPSNRDLEQKLQELETELNQAASNSQTKNTAEPKIQPDGSNSNNPLERLGTTLKIVFNRLPPVGKLLIFILGTGLVLSVFRLLTSVIFLAIVVTLVYYAYQWFFKD